MHDVVGPGPQQYCIREGRRYVRPFYHEWVANVKGAWVGQTLLALFDALFPFQPAGFHVQAIRSGRLVADSRTGERCACL
eukprot:COSAG01_NODE_2842_length_6990_cov_10.019301_2_plen_80_part_00